MAGYRRDRSRNDEIGEELKSCNMKSKIPDYRNKWKWHVWRKLSHKRPKRLNALKSTGRRHWES